MTTHAPVAVLDHEAYIGIFMELARHVRQVQMRAGEGAETGLHRKEVTGRTELEASREETASLPKMSMVARLASGRTR
jgi:hypothetical protein